MKRIEERMGEMVRELPLEYQYEVEDFVRSLLERETRKPRGKLRFDWEGALEDLRDQYISVELQHQISEWMAEEE